MNRIATARTRLLAVLMAPTCAVLLGTASGAENTTSNTTMFQPTQQAKSPEIDAAEKRIAAAKERLDQARQQLSTAKAMVKAAEAEFKASKADRDALALRQTATQLADASGFIPPPNVQGGVIMPANGGNRLTPVASSPAAAPLQATQGTLPAQQPAALGSPAAPTSPVDFNAQPTSDDLRPATVTEPNQVP